jgi:hypothetical protein
MAVPVQQRIHAWRPKAMEAIEQRGRLEPAPPPANLMGKAFKVVDS